jgi:hypothetical protein
MVSVMHPMSKVHLEDHQEYCSQQIEAEKANQRVNTVHKVERKSANIDGIKAHVNDHPNCTLSIVVDLSV